MGFIPSNLDAAFDDAKALTGDSARLAPGEYLVTIEKAEVGPSPKPWIDAQLSVSVVTPEGGRDFINLEVAPLTLKDGTISPGKVGFLKGQLQALGYTGKLSALEANLHTFLGAQVKVRVTDEPQMKNGKPHLKDDGTPWYNHEVKALELVSPGLAGGVAASLPVSTNAVY